MVEGSRPLDGAEPDNTIYVNKRKLEQDLTWFKKGNCDAKGLKVITADKYLHELHHLAEIYDEVFVDFSVAQSMIQRFKDRVIYQP